MTTSSVELSWPDTHVAQITVTGPAPNFCTFEQVERLSARLDEAASGGAHVVVLASGTPGHWLGHASLTDLGNMIEGRPTSGDGVAWFRAIETLARGPMISIAAVSGDTAGGGAELGWACDLRVAAETARFGQPEVMIGLATGLGGASRLLRLIGRSATSEMVLDGAALPATRLHALGAINRITSAERCVDTALAWARRLAERPPDALRVLKTILAEAEELPFSEALASEQRRFQEIARSPAAIAKMAETQARYDAGELPSEVFDAPFEP